MKKFSYCLACLLVAHYVRLAQAQPSSNSAPSKPTHQKAVATIRPAVQQGPTTGKVATGHYYTPQGHYYSPTESGAGRYYSPTASGGGHYNTPQGHYISGSGTYYTPQGHYISASGDKYSPPTNDYTPATGGYYSPQGQYTSGNGQYYTPTNATYTSPQGHIVSPSGSYYTPSNVVYTPSPSHYTSANSSYYTPPNVLYSPRQSQNITPQSQATPQPAASSSINTASAADAANSLKSLTQSGQGSPWITVDAGPDIMFPGGDLSYTTDPSGVRQTTLTLGEGPFSVSGYLTSQNNFGACWSPSPAPGVNLSACGGTDGSHIGASASGPGSTLGFSIPTDKAAAASANWLGTQEIQGGQYIFNGYINSIYGVGNLLGTGLYDAAPSYFNGSH